MSTAEYLHRLGVDRRPPPTVETLVLLHRRHQGRVPYENLGIMLGRPPSVDPAASLDRIAATGRAGYCFHHNGALELVLRDLGFSVSRRHGHVWTAEADRHEPTLNHLVLVVDGLPTDANPGGSWWFDVGLGDAFHDPLPLVEGAHEQGGFRYELDGAGGDGWSFRHDVSGSFTGVEVSDALDTSPVSVLAAHAELSTPPGPFTRLLVAQRRDATGADVLRGCLLSRVEPGTRSEVVLATYAAWRDALAGVLGVALDDVDDGELRRLHARMWAAHQEWEASRP